MLLLLLAGGVRTSGPAPTPPAVRAKGWIDDPRRELRNTITPKQLKKIFDKKTSWRADVNKSYAVVQKAIDRFDEMTPLELAADELAWRISKRDRALARFTETNLDRYRIEAGHLQKRINELYTEIYRLKTIADIEKQNN